MKNKQPDKYESVVQQRDALEKKLADMAAESNAIKDAAKSLLSEASIIYSKYNETQQPDKDLVDMQTLHELQVAMSETPATDAFTRELMANGVESGAEHFRSRARCARGLGHHDRACFLDTTAEMFDEYAESLRKEINDAQ